MKSTSKTYFLLPPIGGTKGGCFPFRGLRGAFFLLVAFSVCLCRAQQVSQNFVNYIEMYSPLAIDQMERYNIPASITLAQALLESGAGDSYVARNANNHFGIKVGVGWTGPYIKHPDDSKDDKFRKYKKVGESYEDHSKFLQQKRYQQLFTLSPKDYKGWANGLKACGYATDPQYANRLISIIERYGLTQYDNGRGGGQWSAPTASNAAVAKVSNSKKETKFARRNIYMVNGIPCVMAEEGDTWAKISQQTGFTTKELMKFNEVSANHVFTPGTNIFLAKKAKKAEKAYKHYWHRISRGESMHDVSQQYGIRLKSLYKKNYRKPGYQPSEGDLLRVR